MPSGNSLPVRFTVQARKDVHDILRWSVTRFGPVAATRYTALIQWAINSLASDPLRAGTRVRQELGHDVRSYHLRLSRTDPPPPFVQRPRHFVLYTANDGTRKVLRIFHDSRDIDAALAPSTP